MMLLGPHGELYTNDPCRAYTLITVLQTTHTQYHNITTPEVIISKPSVGKHQQMQQMWGVDHQEPFIQKTELLEKN